MVANDITVHNKNIRLPIPALTDLHANPWLTLGTYRSGPSQSTHGGGGFSVMQQIRPNYYTILWYKTAGVTVNEYWQYPSSHQQSRPQNFCTQWSQSDQRGEAPWHEKCSQRGPIRQKLGVKSEVVLAQFARQNRKSKLSLGLYSHGLQCCHSSTATQVLAWTWLIH